MSALTKGGAGMNFGDRVIVIETYVRYNLGYVAICAYLKGRQWSRHRLSKFHPVST